MFAKPAVIVAFAGFSLAGNAVAGELQPDTVEAWHQYIHAVKERQKERVASRRPFLWTEESPERLRRVRGGEIVAAPLVGHGIQAVPNGLIHDWIGAAFIPNASVESLAAVLNDYDRYKEIYRPVVTDSKMLACSGADPEFSMTWHRQVIFVNAALEGHYRSHDSTLDARHGYTVADTTQIQEIRGYGRDTQHLLPPDTGSGFIWRMHSITRYEERDGGVYLDRADTRHPICAAVAGQPGSQPSLDQFADGDAAPDPRSGDRTASRTGKVCHVPEPARRYRESGDGGRTLIGNEFRQLYFTGKVPGLANAILILRGVTLPIVLRCSRIGVKDQN